MREGVIQMDKDIRIKVKNHYGSIAKSIGTKNPISCCGSNSKSGCGCGSSHEGIDSIGGTNYTEKELQNLPQDAIAASLGCANPLVFAELKPGETVLDLGSGGGIDVLLASKFVGKTGRIYGLDMTDEMLALANKNKLKMGITNVDFLKGYIEDIPLKDGIIDVIMSNCVINLSGDKHKVFQEAYRVLKPKGRLAIADIVRLKEVPDQVLQNVELWSSCVSGALDINDYKSMLEEVGFKDIVIEPIHIFTKDMINDLMPDEKYSKTACNGDEAFLCSIDGAFAGAHVKAIK